MTDTRPESPYRHHTEHDQPARFSRAALLVLIVLTGWSCTGLEVSVCANGLRCPLGTTCAAAGNMCIAYGCGDGFLDTAAGEMCDDGNNLPGDGCTPDCGVNGPCDDGTRNGDEIDIDCGGRCGSASCVLSQSCESDHHCAVGQCIDGLCLTGRLGGGGAHTCALTATGDVRCWGAGEHGRLGYRDVSNIGDDELPASAGDVQVSDGAVVQVSTGLAHSCAVLDTGDVRCWGYGSHGRLGYSDIIDVVNHVGDDEHPVEKGDVMVGGKVTQLSLGGVQTCALLDSGQVRCWGSGEFGTLGYGNTWNIGDDESPTDTGDVPVGGAAIQLAAGHHHTCALLPDRTVKCWGEGAFGQLGYGNTDNLGGLPSTSPSSNSHVPVGRDVIQVVAGMRHTCALLDTGDVRCWGANDFGQLGHGDTIPVGDSESPPVSMGLVEFSDTVVQLAAGADHNCALLDTGDVHCWGLNDRGQLGYPDAANVGDGELPGDANNVGDDELPGEWGPVNLGEGATVVEIAAGSHHTCALLDNDDVYCWGQGDHGRLGYADTVDIVDPYAAGPVQYRGRVP